MAANATFGKGNFYIAIGDQVERIFSGLELDDLYLRSRISTQTHARLYLITIFQFLESLPDDFAADAVRERMDWKYALHLPANYLGLKETLFCDFRGLLLTRPPFQANFRTLIARLVEIPSLPDQDGLQQDPAEIVKKVCLLSRLANVWNAINQVFEALAVKRPEWLRAISLPFWYERYGRHHHGVDLSTSAQAMTTFAQAIGEDGYYLMQAMEKSNDSELADLPELRWLKGVWFEQYEYIEDGLAWRQEACASCPIHFATNTSELHSGIDD
jgi:transposase